MESPSTIGLRNQVLARVKADGFSTLAEYLQARGVSSFENLCQQLDVNLTPIQVEKILRSEVINSDSFQFFVRALLVLQMHRSCPRGWWKHSEWDRILPSWGSALREVNTAQAKEVRRRLRVRGDLPDGWLPSGVDDPMIVSAFAGIVFEIAVPGPP